ncbi:MAG: hypothetical protein DRQ46_01560 [Gammaproteobacteria bacterium]|nr:MAG: hypothetical protein DRQ46_01560 [Gammaproteobacteria bacterium]
MATRVKALVAERNGIELEYREEINPFGDLLQAFGMLCNDEITVAGGNTDPSLGVGFEAAVGSVYFCSNGNIYKKTGIADTDWTIFSGGSGGAIYMKDILDVDNALDPDNEQVLMFDTATEKWYAKTICQESEDYGLITVPVDCGNSDWGSVA